MTCSTVALGRTGCTAAGALVLDSLVGRDGADVIDVSICRPVT